MAYGRKLQSILLKTVALLLLTSAHGEELFPECEGVVKETFTRSFTDCRAFIFCDGQNSYNGLCDEGEYFSTQDGFCERQELVFCTNQVEPFSSSTLSTTKTTTSLATSPSPTPTTVTTAPSTQSKTTVAKKLSTHSTTVPTSSNFAQSLDISSTVGRTTTLSPITATPTISQCPATDDPFYVTFLPHAKSCSAYYLCVNSKPIEMVCSSMLHFNARTGKCDYPENVKCQVRYVQPHEQCRRHVVDFYPHADNCNYYYLCRKGFLMLEQCPHSYGWDVEKRTCVAMSKAKCSI